MTDAQKFALFSTLSQISRTGWVQLGVPDAESISEHIYGCWLMGNFLLPEMHANPQYDKQMILQMLLLHDLPEAITGDIPRPEKEKDPQYYDSLEQKAAQESLLSGNCPPLHRQLWQEYSDLSSFNALVAKDIDNLQAIFTFAAYKNKHPSLFADDVSARWEAGLQHLQTDVGSQIAARLRPLMKI